MFAVFVCEFIVGLVSVFGMLEICLVCGYGMWFVCGLFAVGGWFDFPWWFRLMGCLSGLCFRDWLLGVVFQWLDVGLAFPIEGCVELVGGALGYGFWVVTIWLF